MPKVMELDLKKNFLYGFEIGWKCLEAVDSIKENLPSDSIPRVTVFDLGGGRYLLSPFAKALTKGKSYVGDGGHHRAIAHYHADLPLPVFIEEFPTEPSKDLLERRIALVQDIPLISSPDVFEARRRSFKGYSN